MRRCASPTLGVVVSAMLGLADPAPARAWVVAEPGAARASGAAERPEAGEGGETGGDPVEAPPEPTREDDEAPPEPTREDDEAPPGSDAPAPELTSPAPTSPPRFDPWAASREGRRSRENAGAGAALGSPSPVPGGYWRLGEAPVPAPPDGDDEVLAGTVLVPVGLLTAASAIPLLYVFQEARCETLAPRLGYHPNAQQCRGLFIGNAIRTVYGVGMLVSGIVLLGVGLHRRKRHREWMHHHVRIDFAPSLRSFRGGVTFRF